MNTLYKRVSTQAIKGSKLEDRIYQIEEFMTKLRKDLKEEIELRKALEKISISNHNGNENQIKALKDALDQIGDLVNDSISDFKNELRNEMEDKNNVLKNFVNKKMKVLDTYDKINADNEFNHKNFENQTRNKLNELDNDIKNNIKSMNDVISTNTNKVNYFEKKFVEEMKYIREEITNIYKELENLKNDVTSLKNFKDISNNNFKNINNDISKQEEIITNFTNKINLSLNYYENEVQHFKEENCNVLLNFNKIKEEVYRHLNIIDNKLSSKLKELFLSIEDKQNFNNCEIERFEKYIYEEQEKFNKFIEEKFNNVNEGNKKLFEVYNKDLNNVKTKNEIIEQNQDSLKDKLYKCLSETDDYYTRKLEKIFKILITNNLIPENFNYDDFKK